MFAPPIFPFKISPSPEPLIQTDVLPVKTIETFGNEEKNDKPAVIYDGDILDYIASKSWNYDEAVAVMMCESSGNRYAVNWNDAKITGMPSLGLFQLNRPYDEKYFDPIYNISEAYELYLRREWSPWHNCATKNNLL